MFPLAPCLKWVWRPLVAKFPSQGTTSVLGSLGSVPRVVCFRMLQSHKGKGDRTGQDVWFRLSLFLKLHMLTHQTLVCIYLCTTVLITSVRVSCWKSEPTLEGELGRVWPDFSCDHVVCFQHRRVVLLTRSSQMLIKRMTTTVHFVLLVGWICMLTVGQYRFAFKTLKELHSHH